MKKLTILFVLTIVVISVTFGQSQRNDYKKIDYISVDEDNIQQFMQLVQDELKSSYNALIESDQIKQWCLYQVQYPGGQKSNYNFISVTLAPSLKVFQDIFPTSSTLAFIPPQTSQTGKQHLNTVSKLYKSELWRIENKLSLTDTADSPSPYMTMDYMNVPPDKNYDYLMLEDEIAKPIHQERMEQDRMQSWEVNSLILPGGKNYGYNFSTSNYFNELEHIEFGFSDEIIKQAMGENSDIPEMFNTIYETRDLVSSELWKLVEHTE